MRPYYERDGARIFCGDSREVLPALEPVRLVVTDPPYMFGMASTANEGKAGGWGDMMNAAGFYADMLREFRRLTIDAAGAAWVFNSWRSFPILTRAAFEARWPIESLMIWDKQWIGPGGHRGLRPSYEVCALFACDGFGIANRSVSDIWPEKWHPAARKFGHSAEKPVALLRRIIRESGHGAVLDPFMGSGSTLVAAAAEGVPAVGVEIEERWCEVAARRLEAAHEVKGATAA